MKSLVLLLAYHYQQIFCTACALFSIDKRYFFRRILLAQLTKSHVYSRWCCSVILVYIQVLCVLCPILCVLLREKIIYIYIYIYDCKIQIVLNYWKVTKYQRQSIKGGPYYTLKNPRSRPGGFVNFSKSNYLQHVDVISKT